jgi:hypothetical protein
MTDVDVRVLSDGEELIVERAAPRINVDPRDRATDVRRGVFDDAVTTEVTSW